MGFQINFLHTYAKKAEELKNDLLNLQKIVDVTADISDVENFIKALEELKFVVDNLPLE